jgi:hypothetical protein
VLGMRSSSSDSSCLPRGIGVHKTEEGKKKDNRERNGDISSLFVYISESHDS